MAHPLPTTPRRDTAAWRMQVWISFGVAASLCAIGLAWLPGAELDRAFMVMGYVYCVSSAFALAKFVRDNEAVRSRLADVEGRGVGRLLRRDGPHRLGPDGA